MSTPTPPFPSFTKTWHTTTYPALSPSTPSLSTKGKNILITGGGSGLGSHIVRSFAQAGAPNIAILGRTSSTLLSTASSIKSSFPEANVHTYTAYITKKDQIDTAFVVFAAAAGVEKIHVCVNNAGYGTKEPLIRDVDPEQWMQSFEINVRGGLHVAQAFLRHATTDSAVLINITSFLSYMPAAGFSAYGASKAACVSLFDSLQAENPGLRVVNMHPGIVGTEMTVRAGGVGMDEASLAADFAVWLASPEAAFTKGRYLWANWDVGELKSRTAEIEGRGLLKMGLCGVPLPE